MTMKYLDDASEISARSRTVRLHINHEKMLIRKVGVLIINARGTHELVARRGAVQLERAQVRLVELVERCAHDEKGVMDAFQGDHFVLTFNAARAVGAPGRNGALVGLCIEEGARRDGLALGQFSMGLSVGRALVGNVGSATMKKNCTVGRVYTNATGLERLAKRVGRTCVVNGRAMGEIEVVAHSLLVGRVELSGYETDLLWAVMSRMEGGDGPEEWLYQVDEASKGNPFREYNAALALLLDGKSAAAAVVLEGLLLSPLSSIHTEVSALRDMAADGKTSDLFFKLV